jgi:hypothetical protein
MPDGFILVKGRVLNGLRDFQHRNYDLYRATILEIQVHINPMHGKQILNSLQFLSKVPKAGTPCQMIFLKQRL